MADKSKQVDLAGLTLICNALQVGATTTGSEGTDITTTEGATTINVGASGTAGTLNIFPTTAARGKTAFTVANNTGDTTTTITTAAQATTRTYTVPDAGASTANFVLSTGTSTSTTATSAELTALAGATSANSSTGKVAILGTSGALAVPGLITSTGGIAHSAGTNILAPIVLGAGTNLTTATAGAIEFDGKCFYATAAASSRQNICTPQRVILTATADLADASIASATPFFAATGAATGAISLVAGTAYEFEQLMWWTNTGTTSHTWSMLFGGTASFTRIMYVAQATTSTGAALTAVSQIPASAATAVVITGASTSATENVVVRAKGIMTINAAGTVIPQILASARPGASGTPGVTAQPGSYFRIWPIGASATIVTGNWS